MDAGLAGAVMMLVCIVVFFAILAALLFHKFLGGFIEGAIGGVHLLVITAVYGGLLISIITLNPLAIVLLIAFAGILTYPFLSEKRADRRFEEARIEGFRTAVELDPRNLAARGKLARALHRQGNIDEAIAHLQELLKIRPNDREEAHYLQKLLEEQQGPDVICPFCKAGNPPGRSHCYRCERFLDPGSAFKVWLLKGGTKQMAVAFTTFAVVLFSVLFGLTMLPFHVRVGASAVVLLAFAGVLSFMRSRSP